MSSVETGQLSAVEIGQMSAAETGQMSAVAKRQMVKSQIGGLALDRRKLSEMGPEWSPVLENPPNESYGRSRALGTGPAAQNLAKQGKKSRSAPDAGAPSQNGHSHVNASSASVVVRNRDTSTCNCSQRL